MDTANLLFKVYPLFVEWVNEVIYFNILRLLTH